MNFCFSLNYFISYVGWQEAGDGRSRDVPRNRFVNVPTSNCLGQSVEKMYVGTLLQIVKLANFPV